MNIKITTKLLLIITAFFCIGIQSLFADFFAYRKLTDPKTGNALYLLYDCHVTLDKNPEETEKLFSLLKKLKANMILEKYFKKDTTEIVKDIKSHLNELRKNIPNIFKQHYDLIEIIRKYNLSIINEENPIIHEENDQKVSKKIEYDEDEINLLNDFMLLPKNITHKQIVKESSPMRNIGKKLTKKYSVNTFNQITNTKTYFYNTDHRSDEKTIEEEEKDCLILEGNAFEAVNILFNTYNQKKIVISAGADHIMAIADKLIKNGYNADPLIISDSLYQQRQKEKDIDTFLTTLEKNDFKEHEKQKLTDETIYYLIEEPIDLNLIFEKEFKETSNKEDSRENIKNSEE